MNTIQKHIEELTGGAFGASGGLIVMEISSPQIEFLMTVLTAFACGIAGALGGYLIKKLTSKNKVDK